LIKWKQAAIQVGVVLLSAIACLGQNSANELFHSCIREAPPIHERIRISHGVLQGTVESTADIELSDDFKKALKPGGDLKVLLSNNDHGEVYCYRLVSDSPLTLPDQMTADLKVKFDEVLKTWKFRPYLLNGKPIVAESSEPLEWKKSRLRVAK